MSNKNYDALTLPSSIKSSINIFMVAPIGTPKTIPINPKISPNTITETSTVRGLIPVELPRILG